MPLGGRPEAGIHRSEQPMLSTILGVIGVIVIMIIAYKAFA
jgi:preprotein translocase subunit SecD